MHLRRSVSLCLLLTQILVISITTVPGIFAEPIPEAATLDAAAPAQVFGIAHGAHLRPVYIKNADGTTYSYGDEVMAFNSLIGKDLAVVMYFTPWSQFDPFLLDEIQKKVPQNRRPVIMLTWEPCENSTGCDLGFRDGQGPLRAINSGRCDTYIRTYARALKSRPERFILRLAHEMNITDSGWWPGRWGQDASAYVAMFRRVRDIFRSEGVTNVEWMWSPNYASNPPDAWNDTHNYYPGDAYVDWIGLSGYNWYGWRSRPWESFAQLYDAVLRDMACRYARPVIISEIGSVDHDTDASAKAAWISQMYARLTEYPFVRGIVWFNDFAYGSRGNPDFRVTTGAQDCHLNGGCTGVQALSGASGQQATNAYINGVRQSTYSSVLPSLAQATPPYTMCSAPSQPFSLSSPTVAMRPGSTSTTNLQGFLYTTPAQITFDLPAGLRGSASPATLSPPWGTAKIVLTADSRLPAGTRTGAIWAGNVKLPITVINPKALIFLPSIRH